MTISATAAELLRANSARDPDDTCRIRTPFEVGAFARAAFDDVVAYGRSLGLTVDVHRGGGLLVQRGWLVASGRWGDMRRFLAAFGRLAEEDR